VKNLKTFSEMLNPSEKLASNTIEKGRFLVDSHMFQVEIHYVLTYHLKASKGIPLLAKNGENLTDK
jgi:hypothetical protein